MEVKKFSDFGIKAKGESFVGPKKAMSKLLNTEIIVLKHKFGPSVYGGERVDLQIKLNDIMMVTWTSSNYIMDMIRNTPADGFPFSTTIKEIDEHYEFT